MPRSVESNIWKLYLFHFLTQLHFVGGVLIPFYVDWGRISFFQIMVLQSFFVISAFLLEIPTGVVADYFGRKVSLLMAVVAGVFAVVVYTSQPDFFAFLIGEFLFAISVALFSGADNAFLYDTLREINRETESKKLFARQESIKMVALMISAPLGSLIAVSLGLRWTMLLMAIPFSVAFVIALAFKEPKIKKTAESDYLQILATGLKFFGSNRDLRLIAIDGVIVAILCFLLIWTYQLVLKQLQIPLEYFGWVHALIALSQIAVMMNFERLEILLRQRSRYLLFSSLFAGSGFMLLGISSDIILAVLSIMAIAGFGLTRLVLITNYMQKHIDSQNRATVLSVVGMMKRFGLAVMYPLVGFTVELSLNYTFLIIGASICICAFVIKTDEQYLID